MKAEAPRVKPFAAILFKHAHILDEGLSLLRQAFPPVTYRGPAHPFTQTDYYAGEMGPGLSRCMLAFEGLAEPGELCSSKWRAHELEQTLSSEGRRTLNIDVGYLDLFKVVLASFKGRGNKLYLDKGVWADITLTYEKGRFHPLPWSFPDFAAGTYEKDLIRIRELLKEDLNAAKPAG
jgi:hypothetical protein